MEHPADVASRDRVSHHIQLLVHIVA